MCQTRGDFDLICLTLLSLVVGWYMMGYEPDTLPSYNKLRDCYYSIILNYTDSPSTPQIHVPRPDPTISSSVSSPASSQPWYRVHEWGGMPPVPQWSHVISKCTPVWGVRPMLILLPPLGIFPLFAHNMFFRNPCDTLVCLMVNLLQDLQHLLRHHPNFTTIQNH